MQIVERCPDNPASKLYLLRLLIVSPWWVVWPIKLRAIADQLNVVLIDTFGIIDSRRVNTLEHTGFGITGVTIAHRFKSEIPEAEHAEDELRDIMTRMIALKLPHTAWLLDAPTAVLVLRVRRSIPITANVYLEAASRKNQWFIRRLRDARSRHIMGSQEIADEVNRLRVSRSRISYVRDKYDPSKIKKITGGKKMDVKMVDRIAIILFTLGLSKANGRTISPSRLNLRALCLSTYSIRRITASLLSR